MAIPNHAIAKFFNDETYGQINTHAIEGNEHNIANANFAIAATAGIQGSCVIGRGHKYSLTRLVIRPTTAVVNGNSDAKIRVYRTPQGTAYGSKQLVKEVSGITSVLGSDTTSTTEFVLDTNIALNGGDLVTIENVAGTGGGVAGQFVVSVYAHEKE